jgi:hypothetical protein
VGDVNLAVAVPDTAGRLPKPCYAGWVDIEWVMGDFTKGGVQQSWRNVVLRIQKGLLQGFFSVPAGFVGRASAMLS